MNWIRIREDKTCTAFGPQASQLLLNNRKALDSLLKDLQYADRINNRWRELYGESATQYVRNSHFVYEGSTVRAAGDGNHCLRYMSPDRVLVIRELLAPCECENNEDYCANCAVTLNN